MPDLVLTPRSDGKFGLQLRYHDLSGTAYQHIATVSEETGREIVRAEACFWLYGDPSRRAASHDRAKEASDAG